MGQFVNNESLNMMTALFLIFVLKLVSFGAVCAWMLFVKESLSCSKSGETPNQFLFRWKPIKAITVDSLLCQLTGFTSEKFIK